MTWLKRTLLIGCTAAMLHFAMPAEEVQAQNYWNNYWGWHNNTYRPYYRQRYGYGNYNNYNRGWSSGYRGYSYPNYGYGSGYGGYGGYGGGYYRGNSVQVGPLRFFWR